MEIAPKEQQQEAVSISSSSTSSVDNHHIVVMGDNKSKTTNLSINTSPLSTSTQSPSKKEQLVSPESRQKLRQFWQRACQDELHKNHQTTLTEAIEMGMTWKKNDKETKDQEQVQLPGAGAGTGTGTGTGESLGKFVIEMREKVKEEISKRNEVELRNRALLIEMEQLQRDFIQVKTQLATIQMDQKKHTITRSVNVEEEKKEDKEEKEEKDNEFVDVAQEKGQSADFWWKEMQIAKKDKENALNQLHEKTLQMMELNACISMQHDELKALRTQENDARFNLLNTEDRFKEITQQNTLLSQENKLLKEDVHHLNVDIGKRSTHFKNLMEKWTSTQAQCEHLNKENHFSIEKINNLRTQNEQLIAANEALRDERDCLQHQVHHLKGAIAAKTAESKAFQAYGTNARDYLQSQNATIQRNQIYRRKINKVAKETVVCLRLMKKNLQTIRAPLVAIQKDFQLFLKNLKRPVLTLVTKSQLFIQIAQGEHRLLRNCFLFAENARKHLHDQLWKARRNALMICQIRNHQDFSTTTTTTQNNPTILPLEYTSADDPMATTTTTSTTTTTINNSISSSTTTTLSANYSTGEIFLKQKEAADTIPTVVKFDTVVSDRTPSKWNPQETIAPFLQSILDGYNGIVTTFEGLPPLKILSSSISTTLTDVPAATFLLRSLFDMVSKRLKEFHRLRFSFSYLAVYKETVYDLLVVPGANNENNHDQNNIVVLEVQNAEEAQLALEGGLENLHQAQQNGILDPEYAHQVLTVCISNENLLTGELTKSKLQIVQLAVGGEEILHGLPKDPEKIKALVSLENGIHALTTSLAEARFKEPAFVRYHSSKLTVLLQDCIKCTSKFLLLMGVSSSSLTKQQSEALETSPALALSSKTNKILRAVQNFRSALYYSTSSASWEHKQPCSDRSFGGFMNRLTDSNSNSHNSNSNNHGMVLQPITKGKEEIIWNHNIPLTFPVEVVHCVGLEDLKWEKELEQMEKRKNHLELIEKQNTIQSIVNFFKPTFYQPEQQQQQQQVEEEEEENKDAVHPIMNSSNQYLQQQKQQEQQKKPEKEKRNRKKKHFSTTTKTTQREEGSYSAFGRTVSHNSTRSSSKTRKNGSASGPVIPTQTCRPPRLVQGGGGHLSPFRLRQETTSSAMKRQVFVTKSTPTIKTVTTIARKKKHYVPFR